MKKVFCLAALIIATIFVLAGCGGGGPFTVKAEKSDYLTAARTIAAGTTYDQGKTTIEIPQKCDGGKSLILGSSVPADAPNAYRVEWRQSIQSPHDCYRVYHSIKDDSVVSYYDKRSPDDPSIGYYSSGGCGPWQDPQMTYATATQYLAGANSSVAIQVPFNLHPKTRRTAVVAGIAFRNSVGEFLYHSWLYVDSEDTNESFAEYIYVRPNWGSPAPMTNISYQVFCDGGELR